MSIPPGPPPIRGWIYIAAWLVYLAMFTVAFVGNGIGVERALRGALANVIPDALLGTALLSLPGRVRLREKGHGPFLATHLGLFLLFATASTLGWMLLVGLDQRWVDGAVQVVIPFRVLPVRLVNNLLVYLTLGGVAYALDYASASRALEARAARAETLRARAELQTLRGQLHPHFLLNTLHALLGLVRRDPAVAETAIERLGDLLRYSLRLESEGVDEVLLDQEWRFMAGYLELERLRLGDRLRTTLDLDPAARSCAVPSFALQTLVENAIHHAIAPRAGGGRLEIHARRSGGRLLVDVSDDGPGPDSTAAAGSRDSAGVGLRLLRDRLAALYGDDAKLELGAAASGGAHARLTLPVRAEPEDAGAA